MLTTSGTSSVSGITNSGSLAVSGNGGAVLDINGPIVNNGTITLNPEESVFNALLRFQTSTSITGNGSIVLVTNSNADDAQITAISSTGTFGASQTIRGAGRMQGTFVNNGIIRADDPADSLVVNATVTNNGQFVAQDANLDLSAATVTGGTFTSSGTGRVRVTNGASSISGVTNNGQLAVKGSGGAFLDLAGPLTNNSTITINPDVEVFNAIVRAQTNMTIAGTGDVVLLAANNIDDAQLQALSGVITIGADQTVRGSGRLQGTFVNNGVIRAEDPAFTLQLFGSAVTNNGVLSGQHADLTLRDTAVTGGTLASSETGFVLANSGLNTMTDVTNTGSMGVSGTGGAFLDLNGSFINNGTITLNPEMSVFNAILRFGSTTSIDGTGDIMLVSSNNRDDAQIVNSGPEVNISAGQTVRGSGRLTGDIRIEGGINPEGVFREIEHTGLSILTLSGSSTATFDLGGTAASTFDRITSATTVSLEGGHCVINIDPAFTPLPGDSWDIVSADTVSGRFNSYDLPTSPVAGYVYRVFYQPDRAFVRLTCGSDFDGDGTLNFFDVSGFLADYNAQDPRADAAAPFGVWNFFDISSFFGAYSTGCP